MMRTEIEYRETLEEAEAKSPQDRLEIDHIESVHGHHMHEFEEWLASIEDDELITKATRMDLSLDDIPEPDYSQGETPGHWLIGEYASARSHSKDSRCREDVQYWVMAWGWGPWHNKYAWF
jgi:hypothetical protein